MLGVIKIQMASSKLPRTYACPQSLLGTFAVQTRGDPCNGSLYCRAHIAPGINPTRSKCEITRLKLYRSQSTNRAESSVCGGLRAGAAEVLGTGGVSDECPRRVAFPAAVFPANRLSAAGVAKKMISQGMRVYEVAFWDPTPTEKLARTSHAPSCPDFVDVVENYTLLLHQGLIENAFLDRRAVQPETFPMRTPPNGLFRPFLLQDCRTLPIDASDTLSSTHPVESVIQHADSKVTHTIRSRHLLGCDGAKSQVRLCIAGGQVGDGEWQGKYTMQGEETDIILSVLDARVKTDFPDIKYKCLIHSRSEGSVRGGARTISVPSQTSEGGKVVSIARDKATLDICVSDQIGQRIASQYTLDRRIILSGDATHTHSPQAGQGMNISMLDMYYLAWKASSRLFSGRGRVASQLPGGVDAEKFISMFKQNAFFTSGCGAIYLANALNALPGARVLGGKHGRAFNPSGVKLAAGQRLARARNAGCGWEPGPAAAGVRIFSSLDVVKMNGAFRIYVFAGDLRKTKTTLDDFPEFIDSPSSFFNRHRTNAGVRSSIVDGPGAVMNTIDSATKTHLFNPFELTVAQGADWVNGAGGPRLLEHGARWRRRDMCGTWRTAAYTRGLAEFIGTPLLDVGAHVKEEGFPSSHPPRGASLDLVRRERREPFDRRPARVSPAYYRELIVPKSSAVKPKTGSPSAAARGYRSRHIFFGLMRVFRHEFMILAGILVFEVVMNYAGYSIARQLQRVGVRATAHRHH
ncbi:hypothetical protein B0H11DRAFT_1927476 [Mycena galericulata]|nr:hypothetical protein B0H11DRAFT_1927476 [Mycena galericulata]